MTYNVFSGTLNPTHFTYPVSVRHTPVFTKAAERSALIFDTEAAARLCCKGIRTSRKITVLPSGSLSQTPNLADFSPFSPRHIDRQLNSTVSTVAFIALMDPSHYARGPRVSTPQHSAAHKSNSMKSMTTFTLAPLGTASHHTPCERLSSVHLY